MKKHIANLLTMSRIVLATIINILLFRENIPLFIIFFLTILIFATDILDGKIARKFNAISKFGVILDVLADLYYVLSCSTILVFRDIMPVPIVICIALEFTVFIVSSRMIQNKYFYFEHFGRILAIIFYLLPSTMLLIWWIGINYLITNLITILCCLFTIIAITNRLFLVLKSLENK